MLVLDKGRNAWKRKSNAEEEKQFGKVNDPLRALCAYSYPTRGALEVRLVKRLSAEEEKVSWNLQE